MRTLSTIAGAVALVLAAPLAASASTGYQIDDELPDGRIVVEPELCDYPDATADNTTFADVTATVQIDGGVTTYLCGGDLIEHFNPGSPERNPLVGVFQVDSYRPRTTAQARTVARLDDDGRLAYREDKPLWGASRWEFVTIYAKDVKRAGSLAGAINAKTKTVGNLTGRIGSVKPGQVVNVAWKLGAGATPKLAWGSGKNVSQQFYTGVKVPSYTPARPATYELELVTSPLMLARELKIRE